MSQEKMNKVIDEYNARFGHMHDEFSTAVYDYLTAGGTSVPIEALTMSQVNTGVIGFMNASGLRSGSNQKYNLYKLLQCYLLDPEKRTAIDELLGATQ